MNIRSLLMLFVCGGQNIAQTNELSVFNYSAVDNKHVSIFSCLVFS